MPQRTYLFECGRTMYLEMKVLNMAGEAEQEKIKGMAASDS